MKYKIYHNPKCSKSRQTLQLLKSSGVDYEILEYIKNPLTADELIDLIAKLKTSAEVIVRKKEDQYRKLNLIDGDEPAHLEALINNPQLMERPIVVCGDRAVICRPPENLKELL